MKSNYNLKRLSLLIAVPSTYVFLFSFPEYWHFVLGHVHIPNLYPFLDMKGRLAHIQGHQIGLDIYNMPNPLDPAGRINDKPSYTLMLSYLGLNLQHAVPLSVFFIILMVFGILLLVKPRNWWQMVAAYLAICSPSVLLAAERGNDDIVIFGFLLIVPIFLSRNNLLSDLVAFCIISIVSPVKYYPFVTYILFAHRDRKNRQILFWLTSSIASVTIFILITYREILFLSSRLPQPEYMHSFGAKLIFDLLGIKFPISQLLTFFIIFFVFISVKIFSLKKRVILPKIYKIEEYYFLLGSSVISFCFFLNSNYDYRLIFCLFLLPALYSWLEKSQLSFYLRFLFTLSIILILVIMWIPYIYYFFERIVFDLSFLSKTILVFRMTLTWLLIIIITILSFLLLHLFPIRCTQI